MKKIYLITTLAIAVFTLSGCNLDGKLKGSGYIDSYNTTSNKKAKFHFKVEDCYGETQGKFKLHDKGARVNIKGTVTSAMICDAAETPATTPISCDPNDFGCIIEIASANDAPVNTICENYCQAGQLKIGFDYDAHGSKKSRDAEHPLDRTGTGFACISLDADEADGNFGASKVEIQLLDGPHIGYLHSDTLNHKKLKKTRLSECEDEDEDA